jgi:hypothetical protein
MISENSENSENIFYCEKCDYKCSKKQHFKQHLLTSKHKNDMKNDKKISENSEDLYKCECGKKYSHQSNLSRHIKKCAKFQKLNEENISFTTEEIEEKSEEENPMNATMILELLKQNNEFKELIIEQNKKILELVTSSNVTNNNNITNNTTNNNKFNLNIFLNEKCKDAFNITDFINGIDVGFKDFENFGRLGYISSISNIFIRELKGLDVYKRPIHCSDLKREVIHVKDNNTWIKDEEKQQMKRAIKLIEHKNVKLIPDWVKANPDSQDYSSKKHDEYNKMLDNVMGEMEDEDNERNYEKIIRNVAKEILIDKEK